jgi:4-carboxymuconolactone decarboxylase
MNRLAYSLLFTGIAALSAPAAEKTTPRTDIDPASHSRVPLLPREQMDAEGQRIWDTLTTGGTVPLSSPAQLAIYSPPAAESNYALNQQMRATVNGVRFYELAVLLAARAFDQQYVWTQHEPTGREAGLQQSVIDVVKFNRGLAGLSEKDATAIRLGRALFREHRVSPALWAKTVELFGRRGAAELAITMGEYAMTAVMLTAVDQQVPAGKQPLLPAGKAP